MPWNVPGKWTLMAAGYCYGDYVCSAYFKANGSGANMAEWHADIKNKGHYELSIWNPKEDNRFFMRQRRGNQNRTQTYVIDYGGNKEEFTLDLNEEEGGWISIGNFYFDKGEVVISLSDKSTSFYVIADAVKLERIN